MKADVLIVGAGPVGLTLAIELVRYGVTVRIIDKANARTDKSKALVVWSRPLELFERSGCSQSFVDAGYKVHNLNIMAGPKPIAQVSLSNLDTKYSYGLMIPQSETERILEEFLAGLGVAVERSIEMTSCSESDSGVVSRLKHEDGAEETCESSWLVGCDGAHSTARHQLKKEFRGDTLSIDWILADVILENVPRKPEVNVIWHDDGVLVTFPMSEERYRIVADVGTVGDGAERPPDPTMEEVQAILDRRFPGGAKAVRPFWLSTFRINERKVADYRSGRIFLAGDSAHVHSPAGGQGMNTGMQDAFNLAWKLALVIRGMAADSLLDSYSAERSPVAEQVLKVTGRLTNMATQQSEVAKFIRNHTAGLILGLSPVQHFAANMASELSIGYPHSPLNAKHAHNEPHPGKRAPIREQEAPVGAGDTPRFALAAAADKMPADLFTRYSQLIESTLRQPYHPDGIWLVRPDGYVALSAKAGEWGAVTEYLDSISSGLVVRDVANQSNA